jgi:transposase
MLELNTAAQCAPSKRSYGRMMAIKALLLGLEFETVMALHDRTRRTLTRWITDFNEAGIDGLIEGKRTGRKRAIEPETVAHCRELIEEPAKAGEVHWTGRKFHGYLREKLGQEVSYSTVIRLFHREGYALKIPQPWSDRQDEEARKAFVALLKEWLADQGIELWFCDESGFEGDPRPRRRWSKIGEKARVTKNGDHVRMNVTGMVCPRTGETFFYEFTHSDTDVFQFFLDEANKATGSSRPRQLLICDNASWHKSKRLDWGRFEPVFLPAYSPDLNPIERLWLLIKQEWFSDFIAKDHEVLEARLDKALCWAIARGAKNSTTCSIKTEV